MSERSPGSAGLKREAVGRRRKIITSQTSQGSLNGKGFQALEESSLQLGDEKREELERLGVG